MDRPLLVIFGRPGAGKGTIASALVERHGFIHCSTGQAMRDWAEGPLPEQQALKVELANGRYGSREMALRIVTDFLAAAPAGVPVIIDGFPRALEQFDDWQAAGLGGIAVVIDTPEAVCRARMARRTWCPADGWTGRTAGESCPVCGGPTRTRSDDIDPAALDTRFASYERLLAPVTEAWVAAGLPVARMTNDSVLDIESAADAIALRVLGHAS
jgi:adenylate kinase